MQSIAMIGTRVLLAVREKLGATERSMPSAPGVPVAGDSNRPFSFEAGAQMTTTPQTILSPLEQARDERLFPVLTSEQLTRATSYGTARSVGADEVLLGPGAQTGSI